MSCINGLTSGLRIVLTGTYVYCQKNGSKYYL